MSPIGHVRLWLQYYALTIAVEAVLYIITAIVVAYMLPVRYDILSSYAVEYFVMALVANGISIAMWYFAKIVYAFLKNMYCADRIEYIDTKLRMAFINLATVVFLEEVLLMYIASLADFSYTWCLIIQFGWCILHGVRKIVFVSSNGSLEYVYHPYMLAIVPLALVRARYMSLYGWSFLTVSILVHVFYNAVVRNITIAIIARKISHAYAVENVIVHGNSSRFSELIVYFNSKEKSAIIVFK